MPADLGRVLDGTTHGEERCLDGALTARGVADVGVVPVATVLRVGHVTAEAVEVLTADVARLGVRVLAVSRGPGVGGLGLHGLPARRPAAHVLQESVLLVIVCAAHDGVLTDEESGLTRVIHTGIPAGIEGGRG